MTHTHVHVAQWSNSSVVMSWKHAHQHYTHDKGFSWVIPISCYALASYSCFFLYTNSFLFMEDISYHLSPSNPFSYTCPLSPLLSPPSLSPPPLSPLSPPLITHTHTHKVSLTYPSRHPLAMALQHIYNPSPSPQYTQTGMTMIWGLHFERLALGPYTHS